MDLAALAELLNDPLPDGAACRDEMVAIGRGRAMFDAREAAVAARADELGLFGAAVVAEVQHTSFGAGQKICDRATTGEALPVLGAAMVQGELSGRQIDTVG